MDQQKQQSWRISVQVRAKNLNIKLKATRFSSTWNFYHFSFLLRLRKYFFKLKSESTISIPRKPRRKFKSRLLKVLHSLKICRAEDRDFSAEKTQHPELKSIGSRFRILSNEKVICVVSWVIGLVKFFLKSISGYSPPVVFCIVVLLKKHITGRRTSWFFVVVCLVVFYFATYFSCILRIFQRLQGLWESNLRERNWVTGTFIH